jgi:hypothetical protein
MTRSTPHKIVEERNGKQKKSTGVRTNTAKRFGG